MKRIFLTGASSGIGLAIAKGLTARGDEVWGTSRSPSKIPKLDRLHPVQLDLTQHDSIEPIFRQALSQAGHFDVVINNAGAGHFGPAEDLSAKELARHFQVLLFAQVELTQLALRVMRPRGTGLIINVSSLAARLPVPFMAAYNAAKSALAAFTMSIQLELGDSPIRILDLQPGDINTPFNDVISKNELTNEFYRPRARKAWIATDRNMKAAPPPELVAQHVMRLMDHRNPPPRVAVGDVFQTKIAPMIFRLIPQSVRLWGLRMYYRI